LTRFPAMLAFRRLLSGSILVLGCPTCAPKSKGWTVTEVPCKPWVNHVQTKMHGLHGERFLVSVCILGRMEQAMPDLTSPRKYQSPGGTGAHLSGLNKLFFGYSILGESVLGPVLPRP
jgi:hypothetical protein